MLLSSFKRAHHRVELAVDLRRPRLLRVVVERLQAVAGDDRHDGVAGREPARGRQLLEHRHGGPAGGLGQQPLGGRQQVDAGEDLGVGGVARAATAFEHRVDHQVAVTGGSDRERVGRRLRRHGVDLGFLGEDRAGDRVAPARLGDVDARAVGLRELQQLQLQQALV